MDKIINLNKHGYIMPQLKVNGEEMVVKVKVGDKVKINASLRNIEDRWTKDKEYDVVRVEAETGYPIVVGDDGDDDTLHQRDWYTIVTRPKAKKEPVEAEVVPVPAGKIGEHEIIGQDKNKEILGIAIDNNLPALLIGETGTGKTSIIREASLLRKQPWVRFNLTGETTVDEFVGKYELEGGKTVWRDGVLLDAMKTGKWLIVDEINVALPEILFVLHSLLDDDKLITVAQHGGEVVKPHDNFRFFATMNPTDEYAGTKELNKAFQSRFGIVLTLKYPPAKVEAKIVADKTGVDLETATKMADVAVALRKAKQDEKIFYTCSTRDLLQWGTMTRLMKDNPGEGFRVSILNKSGNDAKPILEIYNHIVGRYIKMEDEHLTLTVDWFEKQKQSIIDDRKKFEDDKERIRQEITQDIIRQLTEKKATDGVFADKPF